METNTEIRIVNALLLNSGFIDNIGLLHGKMGISIFFFHLARKTKSCTTCGCEYAGQNCGTGDSMWGGASTQENHDANGAQVQDN